MKAQNWQFVSFLSIFHHWLTVEEADECKVFEAFIAKKNGHFDEYAIGEQKFLEFYRRLDTQVNVLRKPKMPLISTHSKNFNRILTKHLDKGICFEFYFPNRQILAETGFDRTDRIFTKNKENLAFIQSLSAKCGLFIIETIDYQDYQKSLDNP